MKYTERLITFLLCISLTLAFTAFEVSAAEGNFVISEGVLIEYIGKEKAVTIPSEVYYIADSAFEGNTTLESVDLNCTEIIGNKAFYGCTSLYELTNTDLISSCGAYAFYNTPFLASKGTNAIVGSVLIRNTAEGAVTLSDRVTSIAPYAFSGNKGITSVTIPDNVAEIGEGAFYNASALAKADVSTNVSYIGAFAFAGTKWLSAQTAEFVSLGNGILIDYNGSSASLTIPNTVKQIAAGTFYGNKTLKSVTLPDTVSYIGMRAFSGCTALSSFNIPKTLKVIDKEAFSGCTSLKEISLPNTLELLGESIFFGCTSLEYAKVYATCFIPAGLFAECTSLKGVIIASGTKYIGDYAFYNCKKLSELSVPESVKHIGATATEGATSLRVWCKKNSYAFDRLSLLGAKVNAVGDANLDGNINVNDATLIQKVTAGIVSADFSNILRGDTDFSGELNVRDATNVQKLSAGMSY
ncbi:MAG: leucine-rich repeat protein [Ruminococcus sp.]